MAISDQAIAVHHVSRVDLPALISLLFLVGIFSREKGMTRPGRGPHMTITYPTYCNLSTAAGQGPGRGFRVWGDR
jgi:hypothetical protein